MRGVSSQSHRPLHSALPDLSVPPLGEPRSLAGRLRLAQGDSRGRLAGALQSEMPLTVDAGGRRRGHIVDVVGRSTAVSMHEADDVPCTAGVSLFIRAGDDAGLWQP
jgi:hypothetical protein